MVVIAQFIPVCVPNLNGLSAKGVCKIISVCTCTCTCVELINMGVSRRVLVVEHEHVDVWFVQHCFCESYTSVHKTLLPPAPLM